MTTKNAVRLVVALGVAGAALFCGDEVNPYVPGKASVSLLASRFADGDTVEIFSTDTFRIELTIQELIDSVGFEAGDNRYNAAGSTVVRRSSYAQSEWPWTFRFPVSFYSTGWTTVRATAWRSDGSAASDSVRLLRVSPLDQQDIVAEPGEVVTLSTDSVDDAALYVWRFGTGDSVWNDRPTATKVITGASFTTGELYVKTAGIRSLPGDPFQVVLADRKAPVITCLNDSLSSDSSVVYTGSLEFYFQVRVQDAGSALAGVQINGGLSDTCRKPTERLWECSKKFTLSGGPELVPIAVRAVDIRGNAALDTFYVVFDSTLVATPQIVVLELADSARIPSRDITVRGEVSSLYGADTVYLTLDVDGASQGSTPALVFGDCDWSYPVSLTRPMGEGSLLSFTLERRAGAVRETTDVAEFVVIYDATVEDITRPTIVSIKSRGVDVADGYYASTSPLALSIEAYDQSGIAWVRIKGLLDSALTTLQSGFYVGDVGLLRGTSGNPVTVTAADNFSNSASETRVVYLNRIPRITRLPPYAVVPAGTVYRDSIGTADSDGDPLTVTVLIEVPGRPPVQVPADPTGVFTWTPSLADMGVARMRVQVSDGYPRIAEGEWTVLVTGGTAAGRPEFRTTAAEFPTALTAGRDSLRVGLRIVQSLDSSTYFFSARIVETDSFIQQPSSDTSLRWLPSLADTGARTLEVIVTNGAGLSDTIVPLPVVSVVAPYAPSQVSFASATWSVREDAGTYLIDVVLDRPSPTALSVGYRVLWGQSGTTVDTSDIRLLGNRVTFGVGATSAQIPVVIVDDTLVEGIEKFTMALDSARPADSILIGNPSSHLCYITNNDTVKFVDTVYFVPPTAVFGPEQARTVYAVIRANRPLSKQVQIAVNRSGTATENADYRIVPSGMPATILMPQGFDRDTFAALTIVDDAECEPSLEYVRLALKPRTPGVVLRKDSSADSVYLYHIYASDTPCVKRVGFIYGGNAPSALELRIGKLIDSAMGVPVEFRNEASVGSGLDPAPYAALFLSSSMANTAVGNMLRGVAIPILNASPANWVSMGLSGVSGEAWASSLRLHVALPWLPMSSVRILEGYAWVPFGQPQTAGYALIASVGTSAGGGVIGKTLAAIGPVTRDTLKTIYQYAGGASSDMPARRCTFPMCRTGDATAPAYTTSWWLLLRGCLYWTLYGFWPVQMDGGGI